MRLIDADALKKHLLSYAGMFTDELGFAVSLQAVSNGVDFQPTIEAEPVVHGRWECEFETYGKLRCSVCKKEALLETTNDALYATSNYCPNCGAAMKMDGGADHD